MQILEDSHDKYDRGHCAECGTWEHREHGRAKYSMFVLRCFDVAATPPAQPSPAIHLSLLKALSDRIYFSSTLNISEFE